MSRVSYAEPCFTQAPNWTESLVLARFFAQGPKKDFVRLKDYERHAEGYQRIYRLVLSLKTSKVRPKAISPMTRNTTTGPALLDIRAGLGLAFSRSSSNMKQ